MRLGQVIRSIIIIIAALIAARMTIIQIDHDFVFDGVFLFLLEAVTGILLCWVILADIYAYYKSKTFKVFIPSLSIFSICFVIYLCSFAIVKHYEERDKSPVKFSIVTKIVDFNGIRIDFREDGTYKLGDYCMGESYYRGTYTLKDSIIELRGQFRGDENWHERFVIRNDGPKDEHGNIERSLYTFDRFGYVTDSYKFVEKQK